VYSYIGCGGQLTLVYQYNVFCIVCRKREKRNGNEGSVMFELVVERREYLVLLLIYKIFKRGFLHDSKRADTV